VRRWGRARAARSEIAEVIARSEARLEGLVYDEATISDENFDYAYSWGVTHGLKAALMMVNGSTADESIDSMSETLTRGIEPE